MKKLALLLALFAVPASAQTYPSPTYNNVTIQGSLTVPTINLSSLSVPQYTATATTGTPPFIVSSTTAVANLNASLLLGNTWAAPGAIGGTTPGSIAATTMSASGQITSTLSTGTAPFSIASTTAVPNLNASLLLGNTWAAPGPIGGTTPGSVAATTVSASGQITSTVTTGTAPLVVASTTNVANLNASSLLGNTWASPAAIGTGTPAAITGTTLTSTVTTGTPPLSVTSTTAVSNLNASLLLGQTWAAPGQIGNTTPQSATFTAINDTGLAVSSPVCTDVSSNLTTTCTNFAVDKTTTVTGVTANTNILTLPANNYLTSIFIRNTTVNAVTVMVGTASGTSDVAPATGTLTVPASGTLMIVTASFAKNWFSNGSTQAIWLNSANWNSANVNVAIYYRVAP